jgi:hypothetical protein
VGLLPFNSKTFLKLGKPSFGKANPQRVHNVVWEHLVRMREGPFDVRSMLGLESNFGGSLPDWCFDRLGATRTRLSDRREVWIAGEHEDYYDPDFCIYNDVVICTPASPDAAADLARDGLEVYTYPREVFPPTDFHTATLVGEAIYVIGCLGYPEDRRPGSTPVVRLDLRTMAIEQIQTHGDGPGWIHKHHASYVPERHVILVRGGLVELGGDAELDAQRGLWQLDLSTRRWAMLREHDPRRYFMICSVFPWTGDSPSFDDFRRVAREHGEVLTAKSDRIVTPPLVFDVHHARVTVDEGTYMFTIRVEGDVPGDVLDDLLERCAQAIRERTRVPWEVHEIETDQSPFS